MVSTPASSQDLVIGADGHPYYRTTTTKGRAQFPPIRYLPKPDGAVIATTGEEHTIRTECHTPNAFRMASELAF